MNRYRSLPLSGGEQKRSLPRTGLLRAALVMALFLLLAFVGPAWAQDAWPRTLVDGLGVEVIINEPPQKILSVSLGADEVLLPLIGPQRFVGVTGLALDPAISNVAVDAAQVPNSIAAAADTERIISLEPDIVFVASFTAPEVIQQLRDAGLTVFATGFPVGFEAIRENVRLLGRAVGAEAEADALIARMDEELAVVSGAVVRDNIVRALYLTPGNYTSGVDSTISEIIAAANGLDVAAAAGVSQLSPVSDEFIIEQNPDVIILSGWTPWDPTFVDTFKGNPAFADLSAVQNGRIYVANDAHLTTVSQFIVEGVKDVAAYLWPEVYPAFPIAVIDAADQQAVIAERPDTILIAEQAEIAAAQDQMLSSLMDETLRIVYVGDSSDVSPSEIDIAFLSAADAEALGDDVGQIGQIVTLYGGATPAETVADIMIIGSALGERVAALEAAAVFTDLIEAEAAG